MKTRSKVAALFALTISSSIALRLTWIIYPESFGGDESTYLVVASRMLHGELPYTTTFDNKPPAAELLQSIAIAISGQSFVYMRFWAALILGVTAFFLASIAFSSRVTWLRLPVAILFIATYTAVDQGAAWQAELSTVLVFALTLWLYLQKSPAFWVASSAGLIPLVRTNWALVSLVILGFLLFRDAPVTKKKIISICAGFLTPLGLIAITYAVTGKFVDFINGSFVLPLLRQENGPLALPASWWPLFVLSLIFIALTIMLDSRTARRQDCKLDLLILCSALALTFIAVLQSPDFEHHSLQIVGFMALSLGRLMNVTMQLKHSSPFERRNLTSVAALVLSIVLIGSAVLTSLRIVRNEIQSWSQARENTSIDDARFEAISQLPNVNDLSLWEIGAPDLLFRFDKSPIHPLAVEACLQANPSVRTAYYGSDPGERASFVELLNKRPDIVVIQWEGCTNAENLWTLRQTLATEYQQLGEPGLGMWLRKNNQ